MQPPQIPGCTLSAVTVHRHKYSNLLLKPTRGADVFLQPALLVAAWWCTRHFFCTMYTSQDGEKSGFVSALVCSRAKIQWYPLTLSKIRKCFQEDPNIFLLYQWFAHQKVWMTAERTLLKINLWFVKGECGRLWLDEGKNELVTHGESGEPACDSEGMHKEAVFLPEFLRSFFSLSDTYINELTICSMMYLLR